MINPLMHGMSACHLMFKVRAREAIHLVGQPGSAIRGGLYGVLSDNFCTAPDGPHTEGHADNCPVCWLLALEDPTNNRGRNLPRPLTIEPPPAGDYEVGNTFRFGITLIGQAQNLFPYVARAVARLGHIGIGRGRERGCGRFTLEEIQEINPLLDATRSLLNMRNVRQPHLQVTPARVSEATPQRASSITLNLLTPTRLTQQKRLVKSPEPYPFVARLIERCQQLATHYGVGNQDVDPILWRDAYQQLTALAHEWTLTYKETEWVEHRSGSRRHKRSTPISGLVGRFRWEGDITPVYPWLVWGQSLHVGKDAVKGNGWYRILRK